MPDRTTVEGNSIEPPYIDIEQELHTFLHVDFTPDEQPLI
jgi:hypothetical protein